MPVPAHCPPSPDLHPSKRARQSPPDKESPTSLPSGGTASPTNDQLHDGPLSLELAHGSAIGAAPGSGRSASTAAKIGQSSNFRNVSACNRCRLRKNRCDQKLPSCASCEKASVACVGYDPITKREIPRSYIFYLEKRVEQLEGILAANHIPFPPADDLDYCSKASSNGPPGNLRPPVDPGNAARPEGPDTVTCARAAEGSGGDGSNKLQRISSKPGPASSDNRYLGSTSGISFARVVFAAVQSSVSDQKSNSEKGGIRPSRPANSIGGHGAGTAGQTTSMRDSFFGLHTKPTSHPAHFPNKALGQKLVRLYFEHANPQIPVLHRVDFMNMFERAYLEEGRVRGPRELYFLNMVFAIGAGILVGDPKGEPQGAEPSDSSSGSRQYQPEAYHASAIVHLEACLGSGGLEDLQAVLLLANFALLRPVPPGLWYIIGVAVRLAVDLGLHYEDPKELENGQWESSALQKPTFVREKGRREYMRDMRRRLWWCTYSLDRLVSVCVGRPFGISDHFITTEFPSLLDDEYITHDGIIEPPSERRLPSYKLVAQHYFRLRLLQSEILQVLHYRQVLSARAGGQNYQNLYMPTLPSAFLSKFDSFRSWRIDIDRRLWEWKNTAPRKEDTGVSFSTEFLELNYWQAIIMLYRQSLSTPTVFEGEYDTSKEVNNPTMYNVEPCEDEDRVYLKIAEAGQKILRLYRQLHLQGLVNHAYLTTHHLFVAGISYLYAIWHSPIVRSRLTMDEVDFTVLAATSVFTDFIDKCPPAEACRDAFDRTVKATLKMVNASGGFGQQYRSGHCNTAGSDSQHTFENARQEWHPKADNTSSAGSKLSHSSNKRPRPHHSLVDKMPAVTSSDAYSNASSCFISSFSSKLGAGSYLLAGPPAGPSVIKTEPGAYHSSVVRNFPRPPRSTASSTDNPTTPETSIEQSPMITSPSVSTVTGIQQQQAINSPMSGGATPTNNDFHSPRLSHQQPPMQQQFSPAPAGTPTRGAMSLSELQGLEFLQSLNNAGSVNSGANSSSGANNNNGLSPSGLMDGIDFTGLTAEAQMDLGFGLAWEGMHHDYSEGQSLDLFDGFFFGGGGTM